MNYFRALGMFVALAFVAGITFGNAQANEAVINSTALTAGYHDTLFTTLIRNQNVDQSMIVVDGDLRVTGRIYGIGGEFAGVTEDQFPNNHEVDGKKGYAAMHHECDAAFGGEAYMCSSMDILNIMKNEGYLDGNGEPVAEWVSGRDGRIAVGPPGFPSTTVPNDCESFTSTANNRLFRAYLFDSDIDNPEPQAKIMRCDIPVRNACCR